MQIIIIPVVNPLRVEFLMTVGKQKAFSKSAKNQTYLDQPLIADSSSSDGCSAPT